MPRNLSAWIDICIHLAVILLLVLVISSYNLYVGTIALVVWACMAASCSSMKSAKWTKCCRTNC